MAQLTVDLEKMQTVGSNVLATEVGDKLVLVIDTGITVGASTSGKMMGVGNTGGFTMLPHGLKGNIYIGKSLKGG